MVPGRPLAPFPSFSSCPRACPYRVTSPWFLPPDLVRRAAIVPSITRSVHAKVTVGGALDQDLEAGHHRLTQRPQVVPAFEGPHGAATRMLDRPAHDRGGKLAVALCGDLEPCQRVVLVRIEAGRHQQEVGMECGECRTDLLFPGAEKPRIAAAARERYVEDIAMRSALSGSAGPRIKRVLMGRRVEDLGIIFETVLRAVAVVDIEVEHAQAANAPGACRQEAYGDVVDQAEAHGLRVLGVVAGRPYHRDGVPHLSMEYPVHALNHPAGCRTRGPHRQRR